LISELIRIRPEGLPVDIIALSLEELHDPIFGRMLDPCIIVYDGLRGCQFPFSLASRARKPRLV